MTKNDRRRDRTAQVFHPAMNAISRISLIGVGLLVIGIGWVSAAVFRSPYFTDVGLARVQPVPFSHKHHTTEIGIDCRYCHTMVEKSPSAGIPPTHTCMTCHALVHKDAPMLEPIRESWKTGLPVKWIRVHDLPDFVYFDHSIHIHKGVGCSTCHGRVDKMPLTWKANSLYMEWCLNCHRHPEKYLRPRDQVFNMSWQPPANQEELGRKLMKRYNVNARTNCYTCHR